MRRQSTNGRLYQMDDWKGTIETYQCCSESWEFQKMVRKVVSQHADALYIRRQIKEVNSDVPRKPRAPKGKKAEPRKDTRNWLKQKSQKILKTQQNAYLEIRVAFLKTAKDMVRLFASLACLIMTTNWKGTRTSSLILCLRMSDHKEKNCTNKTKKCKSCGKHHLEGDGSSSNHFLFLGLPKSIAIFLY